MEAACRVLADTERGLTGAQIERLLQEIKIADVSPGITKWKRLFNALAEAQNQHQIGNHLILLINLAMNPVNYARDPGAFRWRRDELNVVLAFSGFFVRDDGRVGYADKATTLDAARARAGRLGSQPGELTRPWLRWCLLPSTGNSAFLDVGESTIPTEKRQQCLASVARGSPKPVPPRIPGS